MGNTYQNDNITFEDCKLNREQYADTIINLVNNSSNLTENNSFVIALDSPWGTGKSVFAKMLKNKITMCSCSEGISCNGNKGTNCDGNKTTKRSGNSMASCNENISVIIYNAWKNDYYQNPFETLFYD